MKKVLFLSFLIILIPITTFARSGKDAYQSLKKIQMEIDTGISSFAPLNKGLQRTIIFSFYFF
jgi:hypothetical protein